MKAHTLPISLLLTLILTSTALAVYIEGKSSPPLVRTSARSRIPRGHLTVWKDVSGAPVGTLDPILYTSPIPESAKALIHHTTVTPACRVRVVALSAHQFWIRPDIAWPDHTHVRVAVAPPGVRTQSTEFITDAGKSVTVNLTLQKVYAYEDGRLVRIMPTSTGVIPDWATPTGTFWIFRKVPDDHMKGGTPGTTDTWNIRHVPWAQYIYRGIAIHGAWWNHRFGTPLSHGCIQLATRTNNPDPGMIPDDAKWLYDFTDIGTPVIVTGKTPPTSKRPLPYPRPDPIRSVPTVSRSAASSIP